MANSKCLDADVYMTLPALLLLLRLPYHIPFHLSSIHAYTYIFTPLQAAVSINATTNFIPPASLALTLTLADVLGFDFAARSNLPFETPTRLT